MATYNTYASHPLFDQQYDHQQATYPATTSAGFDFNMYSYAHDTSYIYPDTSMDDKFNMARSPSSHSDMRGTYEVPALHAPGSAGSTSSSTVGSPYSGHAQMMPVHDAYHQPAPANYTNPSIFCDEQYHADYLGHFAADLPFADEKLSGTFVDPVMTTSPHTAWQQFPVVHQSNLFQPSMSVSPAPSPVPSSHGYNTFRLPVTVDNCRPSHSMKRESSVSSQTLAPSPRSSHSGDDEDVNNRRCTYPDCGKIFKDLKAHMLTHESVRPERCPIPSCPYHKKGFARKYDCNRHTLTHYKGTMVCGFCPGSGSPAEKSFNRADVFKRHLITLHKVERDAPNGRKRNPGSPGKRGTNASPDATGKCSTCSKTFTNPQGFYEHLDECVLKVVQQEDPNEAANVANLGAVDCDPALQAIYDRNHIGADQLDFKYDDEADEDHEGNEDDDDEEDDEDEEAYEASGLPVARPTKRAIIGGGVSKSLKPARRGMTWSKGGVPLVKKGRKRRKNNPQSWGIAAEKMKMKKRVLCVYNGPHRMLKDDMMMNNEFEVRVKLDDGPHYVTDLDVATCRRAEAYHNATAEEKSYQNATAEEQAAWIAQQDFLPEFMQ